MKKWCTGLALLLAACGSKEKPAVEARASAPIAVQTITAVTTDWPEEREVSGTVKARVTGTIASRIMAQIRELRVTTGDAVQAGQVLVVLDSNDLDTARRQAEEAMREARSGEGEAAAAIQLAKAQLDLAQTTFRRMKDLHEKRSISNQEFDEAQARVRVAEANQEMALAKQRQVQARISQAGEAVKNASITKTYAELTAPFSGVVMEKRAEAGSMATPGMPLLVIEQAGSYRLEIPVEESLAATLRKGSRVPAVLDATDRTVTATVGEIAPSADAATRTIVVKLDLPGVPNLRSGMSGKARFSMKTSKALTIPAAAVHQQGSLSVLYVPDQGKARSRIVTVGDRRGEAVQVLSGLVENERVIHPLPNTVADGSTVEVHP